MHLIDICSRKTPYMKIEMALNSSPPHPPREKLKIFYLCIHFFTQSASSKPPTHINRFFYNAKNNTFFNNTEYNKTEYFSYIYIIKLTIFILKSLSSRLFSSEFKSSVVSTTEKLNSLEGRRDCVLSVADL